MGKNKIKEYDTTNNFESFARTMNNNSIIDLQPSGISNRDGGGAWTQPFPTGEAKVNQNVAGGVPITAATNRDGGGVNLTLTKNTPTLSTGGAQSTKPSPLPEPKAKPPVTPVQETVTETVATAPAGTDTVTETVATAPTGTETVTETVTDSGDTASGAVSGATSGTTIATAPMISGTPLVSGSKQTFEEWAAAGGYDPDAEYGKAKSELEYSYMQNMSRFGENAERLAQMGLSGSGVSDIYQLGAYNSYLQSHNALAAQNIAAKKQLRQEYNTYSQTYDNNAKADYANAHNLGLQYYDGTNADYVRQILTNQGYDQSIIDQAMNTLSGYDINALPTIKQRAADEAADTEAFNNAVAEGYAKVLENGMYNGANGAELEQRLVNLGYSAEEAAAIVERLTGDEALGKDIQNDTVNAYYEQYKGEYTPETEARIRAELAGTPGEAVADALIEKLKANYNATPEDQRPGYVDMKQVMALGRSALVDGDGNMIDYNGSAQHKKAIRNALEAQGLGKYVDQVLEDFDSELTAGLKPDGAGNYDVQNVSLEKLLGKYNSSGQITKDRLTKDTQKVLEQTISDEGSLMNAYNLVGIDKASWDKMSDWERLSTVVDKIGYYSKTGLVDQDYFIEKAVELINESEAFTDEDFVAYAYETGYKGNGGSDGNVTIKVDDDYLKKYRDKYKGVYEDSRGDHGVASDIKTLIDGWVSKGYISNADEIKGLKIYEKLAGGRKKLSDEGEAALALGKAAGDTLKIAKMLLYPGGIK